MYKKKFGGKTFNLHYRSMSKKKVDKAKKEMQEHGWLVRITTFKGNRKKGKDVPRGHGGFKYAVWIRKKS